MTGFDPSKAGSPGQPGGQDPSDVTTEPEAEVVTEDAPRVTSDETSAPGSADAFAESNPAGGAGAADPSAEGEVVDSEADAELAALLEKAGKADEYLALAQRTQADFENYRKRSLRDAKLAEVRGISRLAKELLPAVDNLDRALSAAQSAAAAAGEGDEVHGQLVSGIQLVHADVISALQRAGIEGFSPQGETFDPQFHEAVAQAPVPGAEPGSVVEVYQRGYKLGETVLRPARVLVAA
jgi:molecular chaperone GrpE